MTAHLPTTLPSFGFLAGAHAKTYSCSNIILFSIAQPQTTERRRPEFESRTIALHTTTLLQLVSNTAASKPETATCQGWQIPFEPTHSKNHRHLSWTRPGIGERGMTHLPIAWQTQLYSERQRAAFKTRTTPNTQLSGHISS